MQSVPRPQFKSITQSSLQSANVWTPDKLQIVPAEMKLLNYFVYVSAAGGQVAGGGRWAAVCKQTPAGDEILVQIARFPATPGPGHAPPAPPTICKS